MIVRTVFGLVSYLVSLMGLVAFMLYMGSWDFLPFHVSSEVADATTITAVSVNLLIVLLFGIHHSVAARDGIKKRLQSVFPGELERSFYVLISGCFMFAICLFWQPLPGTVWNIERWGVSEFLKVVHVLGWLVTVAATFEIDHFQLMGIKQSFNKRSNESDQIKEGALYRVVRHPIQAGVLLGIWSTAVMSTTQFMLSACLTIYIFVGLHFEEKALVAHFGDKYLDYRKRVPGLVPFWPWR